MAEVSLRKTPTKLVFPDESEQSSAGVISQPSSGDYRITEVHIDQATEEVVITYSETPAP